MKKLFLSSALSITSLFITPSVFAGPGESLGNTKMIAIPVQVIVQSPQQNSVQKYIK